MRSRDHDDAEQLARDAGGMLIAIPYLFNKRREILGGSKKAS